MNRKKYMLSITIALYFWVASFFLERLWFDIGYIKLTNKVYVVSKIMLLVILMVISFTSIYIINKLERNSIYFQFFIKIFILYFAIMFLILLLTWPGIWRWDEIWILNGSQYFQLNSYQHFLTSYFYIISLMMIPFPAGVVISQIIVISLIIACVIVLINKYFISSRKICYLLLIPFMFFAVIDSNLYPIRSTLYAYIELLFIISVISIYKKHNTDKKDLEWKEIIFFILLTIILAVWRTEGFYYAILGPIILLVFFWKNSFFTKKVVLVLLIFSLACLGKHYQDQLSSKAIGDQNIVISCLNYIEYVINNEKLANGSKNHLNKIEKVINLKVLKEKGQAVIWDSKMNLLKTGEYTRTDFKKFELAYIKMVISNPIEFIKCQKNKFLIANGIIKGEQFIEDPSMMYHPESEIYNNDSVKEAFYNKSLNWASSVKIRTSIIRFIEHKNKNGYNGIIPMIALIFNVVYFLKKKYFKIAFLLCLPIIRIPLIFSTSPGSSFMYYFSIYIIGYFTLFVFIGRKLERAQK